ncbi:MAG: hypothetical protein IT453_10990 [Planctomycetes bacterium]|nr:hypothetical protein [Planctomycetota bacterium]
MTKSLRGLIDSVQAERAAIIARTAADLAADEAARSMAVSVGPAKRAVLACVRFCATGYTPSSEPYDGRCYLDAKREPYLHRLEREGIEFDWRMTGDGPLPSAGVGFCEQFRNARFCARWVRETWVPSVPLVLETLGVTRVESFDPGHNVLRVARLLYVRLLKSHASDRAAAAVIRDLTKARSHLGIDRHRLSPYFALLAEQFGVTLVDEVAARWRVLDHRPGPPWWKLTPSGVDASRPLGASAVLDMIDDGPERVIVQRVASGHLLDSATIAGSACCALFRLVAAQPGRSHSWRDLLRSMLARQETTSTEVESLRRAGNRVRTMLGVMGCYWQQDGRSVRWDPPVGNE